MPVIFKVNNKCGYFIATWEGIITDSELLSAYKNFVESDEWSPGLNELADLSKTNFEKLSSNGLQALGTYAEQVYLNNNSSIKTAAYCPNDLPFGIARIYEAWSHDSLENVKVFRERHIAETWLTNEKEN